LIDCGQFKALPRPQRVQLAEIVVRVAEYQESVQEGMGIPDAKKRVADLVRDFGVKFVEGKEDDNDLACSVALFLFGDEDLELPGGYSNNELDENSPIKLVASFPQELVLMGRATVLLKGIAKRLEVPFSLADKWGPGCALTIDAASQPTLPLWGRDVEAAALAADRIQSSGAKADKIRFQQVAKLLKQWGKGKGKRFLERVVKKLPPNLKAKVIEAELRRQQREDGSMAL